MPKIAPRNLAIPTAELTDFVAVLKELIDTLFQYAHTHTPKTAVPAATDGTVGDIIPVVSADGTTKKLYVKTHLGWFSTTLS